MIVRVTQGDINLANTLRDASFIRCFCPIALACKRLGLGQVRVIYNEIITESRWYKIPNHIVTWIKNWDSRQLVSPINFQMLEENNHPTIVEIYGSYYMNRPRIKEINKG